MSLRQKKGVVGSKGSLVMEGDRDGGGERRLSRSDAQDVATSLLGAPPRGSRGKKSPDLKRDVWGKGESTQQLRESKKGAADHVGTVPNSRKGRSAFEGIKKNLDFKGREKMGDEDPGPGMGT